MPALPPKSKEHNEPEASKRQQVYNRFLLAISRSETLKSSKFLCQFLKLSERDEWKFNKRINLKPRFTRQLSDVISVEGQVSVKYRKNCEQYCGKVKKWAERYLSLNKEAYNLSREVHTRSGQLSEYINKLAECFENLGSFNKKLKITS